MPDPDIIRVAREYRQALVAREDAQIYRMANAWRGIERSLSDEMLLLAVQIRDEQLKGGIITEQLINRMSRYEQLDKQMKREILKYANGPALKDIKFEQMEYGKLGLQGANDILRLQGSLGAAFDQLGVDHIEQYVGMLGDGSPLNTLLKEAYPDALDGVVKGLLEGSAKGLNPNQVAYQMAKGMGMGLERINLIARTEQLRVNRLVSADQYRATGLPGYMRRVSAKDSSVCMACLVSDGEVISLEENLTDHPRGRCTVIFQIGGAKPITWETGSAWFNKQDPELQKQMLGDERFLAWKNNKFPLQFLRADNYNKVWGNSPRVPSLAELGVGHVGKAKVVTPRKVAPPLPKRVKLPPRKITPQSIELPPINEEVMAGVRRSKGGIEIIPSEGAHTPGAFDSMRVRIRGNGEGILKTDLSRNGWGHYNSKEGFAKREVAASQVSEKLKLGVVPKTTPFIEGKEYNSLQVWIDNAKLGSRVRDATLADLEDPGKMNLLDMVLDNTDRHGGNWLLGPDKKLKAIDNGLTMLNLSDEAEHNTNWVRRMQEALSDEMQQKTMWKGRFYLTSKYKTATQKALDSGELREIFEAATTGNAAQDAKLVNASLKRVQSILDTWDKWFFEKKVVK